MTIILVSHIFYQVENFALFVKFTKNELILCLSCEYVPSFLSFFFQGRSLLVLQFLKNCHFKWLLLLVLSERDINHNGDNGMKRTGEPGTALAALYRYTGSDWCLIESYVTVVGL